MEQIARVIEEMVNSYPRITEKEIWEYLPACYEEMEKTDFICLFSILDLCHGSMTNERKYRI